jgi:hypothetical protein
MLADQPPTPALGRFAEDLHLRATARVEILDFIAEELPLWRDCPERPLGSSETILTDQLCSFLNGASRKKSGWDFLQFRTEVADELRLARKIDLVPKPSGTAVWIEGRRHTQFDALLPIECKRLPTPTGEGREEREYVFTDNSTTGGIQRFKCGLHGGAHTIAGMIGYVQSGTLNHWEKTISEWILDLSKRKVPGWSAKDDISLITEHLNEGLSQSRSLHSRGSGLADIQIRHMWISMTHRSRSQDKPN